MEITFPLFKFVLIFIVVVGWVYYRLLRTRKKRGQLRGRERWKEGFRERREERTRGARTWEKRRRLKSAADPEREIAARYLRESKSEKDPAGGVSCGKEPES